jgi:TonB family protein
MFSTMLAPAPTPPRRRFAWLTSAAIHAALLACALYHPPAIFVSPRFAAHGNGGSAQVVYLTTASDLSVSPKSSERTTRLTAPSAAPVLRITRLSKKESLGRSLHPAHAAAAGGSTYGSMLEGTVGAEVRPALPEVFPDPDVDRASLPPSVQGDVIVEITIDERGNVTDERLLTGVDHSIDEKVIAALKNWHFRPATNDGVPIPSKQDVHFHFPS